MEGQFSYLQLLASVNTPDQRGSSRLPHIHGEQSVAFEIPESRHDEQPFNADCPSSSHTMEYDVQCGTDFYIGRGHISSSSDEESSRGDGESDEDWELNRLEVSSEEAEEDTEDFNFMLPLDENAKDDEEDSDIPVQQRSDNGVLEDSHLPDEDQTEEAVVEPRAPYKKRIRHKKGEVLPSSRQPKSVGPIEIAFRSSSDRKTEQIFKPIVGTSFDSAAEAYEFYNLYSWEKGFGISYGKSDTNRGNKYRTMQELQCSNQGFDRRVAYQSQRCGCKAAVRLLRTEDHGWYISKFIEGHNHALSESCGEKMQWSSHRRIDDSAKLMIRHLRDNNVPLGKVHSIMGSIHGSVRDLPFTKRSLRTLCQQLAKEQMDDDVKKTLQIFREMRKEDPDFSYSVDVDKHNRIKTLIWTNHRSKMQYHCFGDVFTFDTTYCTNIYKMPFGLFVGVNNHFQSVIFAGVLMRHETIKSFTWVFNEFLSLMGGKAPITILTDQAPAMLPAVAASMPNTTHLWCKWHVLRKAQESLGSVYSKKSAFRPEFHKVLNEMLTIDEFEAAWEILISKYKLKNHPFMVRIYECRDKWAKPYSKGKFCARMMSTQRGESANHILKTYIRGNSTMNNFVSKYNDMMFDRAMEEDREEHKTKMQKKPSHRMWPLQNHACKIYTRATFKLFTMELEKSYHYVVSHDEGSKNYQVDHAYAELREPWVRVRFVVTVCREEEMYECECGLFTHFGIICCHCIRVMNYLGVAKIPGHYIMKRWTRDARDMLPEHLRFLQKDNRAMKSHTCRDNLLYGTAMKAVKSGNQDMDTFTEMMKHLVAGIKAVSEIVAARGEVLPNEEQPLYESSDNEWHRAHATGCQSELGVEVEGRTIYSDEREGAVPSQFDIAKLKGPLIAKQGSGRKRFKRFLSPIEKNYKGKKKTPGSKRTVTKYVKQTSFCSVCRQAGHKKDKCPENPDAGKNKRKKPCCSTCNLPGHKSNNCHLITPDVDNFDINDLDEEDNAEG